MTEMIEEWDVWYPAAGATGLPVGRGRVDPTPVLWLHAAPEVITVTIRDDVGRVVGHGQDLRRTSPAPRPMTRLWREGHRILREDRWPDDSDLGAMVLLPGGEVGRLTAWWHADDQRAWRWSVEFSNRIEDAQPAD